ncbi:glycosyltransferase family 2 protein [Hymenobacter sp. HDW8]|uniref:glycosyltransferase family 2 protein n=1 Tax=Hymenobacter sp. HDW8 TaxID=2714932 RepID=UPI001409A69C|nr:glycosyltransferase [Hymenobacter sp. HDW8]QIL77238.1 glycosyltransferase [Hymenobacter sp. HDW8]
MDEIAPKVTVIIPNYNHARYLPQRIESVLNQSYNNFEVIILDDYSTDNSREIIERYKDSDKRIRVVYNNQNSGSTFKQWNKGFNLAKGQYIWIAESDDYADLYFLEKLIVILDSDDHIGLGYCDSWHVFEEQNSIERNTKLYSELDSYLWTTNFVIDGIYLVKKFMSYRNIIPNASAVLIRRSVIQQVEPANEKMRLVGDWLFWASIMAVSKVAFVVEPLNFYRHHNNNVRSRTLINGVYYLELSKLLGIIKKYGEPDKLFFGIMVDSILEMWLKSMLEYQIPLRRHYIIYKNLTGLSPDIKRKTDFELNKFLFSNKLSGLRQIMGDGILYPILRRLRSDFDSKK